jgi:hypothetical protein
MQVCILMGVFAGLFSFHELIASVDACCNCGSQACIGISRLSEAVSCISSYLCPCYFVADWKVVIGEIRILRNLPARRYIITIPYVAIFNESLYPDALTIITLTELY